MLAILRRAALPVVVVVSLWLAFTMGVTTLVDWVWGAYTSERLEPLMNVHLEEEALEGSYNPALDLAYVLYTAAKALVAFGIGGFVGAFRGNRRERKLAIGAGVLCVALPFPLYLIALSPYVATAMRFAALEQLFFFAGSYALGVQLAARLFPTGVNARGA